MIKIQTTKRGNIAYVFSGDYAEAAKEMFPYFAAALLGQTGSNTVTKTMADVIRAVDPKHLKGASVPLLCGGPSTVTEIPGSEPMLRKHIRSLIFELCSKDGLKTGRAWNKAYRMLYESTGYDVTQSDLVMYRGKPSLISTVLRDGRGRELVKVLRKYLDN